ncbi:Nif3-like dinuclear metal center hexameric protein [Stieleria sp. ICT_E10.1]|uniref:Nif3-like dinuclear metal center hexameric protein n=1 Tax=Stieleria sedimenti TaxID=2976331 RepID=UPI00217FCDF9|nr:Nif3-like dinuclear metal center hexameric protein [Stieleria sedimenti]MCS7468953.1 Nif3-like dinuclear metal center hexameric protein [Stieleria sedimenti]
MSAVTVDAVCQTLSQWAPLELAESWDNVGLLIGDRHREIGKVMTCLTVTPGVVTEAIEQQADLIVTHHPIPFRPLPRITCDSITGELLWRLIGAKIAVYSAHTAFDSATEGINQRWAESLGLASIQPINDPTAENLLGSGRHGTLPTETPTREVIRRCAEWVDCRQAPRGVGPLDRPITRVGFACGSGGSFVARAARCGCQLLITGEASFHDCLEAESRGMALGLLGHYHSERFAMEQLAERLAEAFPALTLWPSAAESDPIETV